MKQSVALLFYKRKDTNDTKRTFMYHQCVVSVLVQKIDEHLIDWCIYQINLCKQSL